MRFHIVSLFPEFFDSPLAVALMGRARNAGLVSFSFHNPRDAATDRHRTVDDRPYGGGPGMVMLPEPLARTLRALPRPGRMLVMAPGGRPFTQAMARELATAADVTLICGRYEGLDARISDVLPLEYVSVGDAVLNGGETAALAVIEAVARLTPGFMGKEESSEEESFSSGLLEYPHYTRPENFEGHAVPEVLRSGDHARIAAWRREQSLLATLRIRPDLLAEAPLNAQDAACLDALPRERPGRNLRLALVHYPVMGEGENSGVSSLTNLDIHDIAHSSCTYGLRKFYVVTSLDDQMRVLEDIPLHWTRGPGAADTPDRGRAFSLVQPAHSIEEATAQIQEDVGERPLVVGTSTRWPRAKNVPPLLTPGTVREWLRRAPVLLLLGTGHGLAPEVLATCDGILRPLRFMDGHNHLSVRAAAAIMIDRILGDFY